MLMASPMTAIARECRGTCDAPGRDSGNVEIPRAAIAPSILWFVTCPPSDRAGTKLRWVADPLGHADPAFTLRVYARAMRDEKTDLSFAELGSPGRPSPGPTEPE
jgi:hypothetical protein